MFSISKKPIKISYLTQLMMKKHTLFILTLAFGLSYSYHMVAQDNVLIKNATVLTITQGELKNTDVLIQKGKIKKIDQGINVPKNTLVIDATGKYLMPGIVDAHSHLITLATNEGTNPVTAEVTIEEGYDPNSVAIYRALAGGVTTIHLMHGSANVIGGQNETLKLRYGSDIDGLRFKGAPRTIKFALGENPTRVHGQNNQVFPRTRMGVEQIIRQHFDSALDYKKRRMHYLNNKKNKRGIPPIPVAKNIRLEVINDILEGKVLIHCHSYRADEIMMLMNIFDDYGIQNYTFQHVNEGFKNCQGAATTPSRSIRFFGLVGL